MPLASVALPLVAKLFPDARILFARRDPRDVMLSCFRRRFGMNPSMYQLLTLEGAAAYYDSVMRLSEVYREILPLTASIWSAMKAWSTISRARARAACQFLGLNGMRVCSISRESALPRNCHSQRGPGRPRTQPRGPGVWRRYREQMAPVLPCLNPGSGASATSSDELSSRVDRVYFGKTSFSGRRSRAFLNSE